MLGLLGHSFYIDSFDYWGGKVGMTPVNNPHKLRLDYIRSLDFNCIIVGSSRGQTFSPYQLSERTGLNCVNMSVGGANTGLKQFYIKEAMKNNKIKKLVYVSDFYEFFSSPLPDELFFQAELFDGIQKFEKNRAPSLLEFFVMLVDQVRFNRDTEAYLTQKKLEDVIGARGEKPSFGLERYELDNKYELRKKSDLNRDILRDFTNYSKNVWLGPFLEKKVKKLKSFFSEINNKGVEVNVILSPYHPRFRRMFEESLPELQKGKEYWRKELGSSPAVIVYDFDEISNKLLDDSNKYWDDGVHLNKFGAGKLLKLVK